MKQISLKSIGRFFHMLLLAAVWCVIAALVFCAATVLLRPKWYEDSYWEAATKIEDGLYALPDNSIDVLFMGSSHAFRGFNPLELYQDYGITSYVFSGSTQRTWTTYTYLQEALKTQSPKVVVIDSYCFFTLDQNDESRNHKQFDYLKPSESKTDGLVEAMREDEKQIDYEFPLLYYHSRWSDLNKNDFTYFTSDKSYYLRGYDITFSTTAVDADKWTYEIPCDIYGVNMFYDYDNNKARRALDAICRLCQEKGIQVYFTAVPTADWHIDEAECVSNLAGEYGFSFFDYCTQEQLDRIGIDPATDFQDNGYHLNVYGTQKFSRVLGEDLVTRYGLADHRGEEGDAEWQQDIRQYQARIVANQLTKDSDVAAYVEHLSQLDENYLVCITGTENWRDSFDQPQLDLFAGTLGLNVNDFSNVSYVCNYEDGMMYLNQKNYTLNRNVDGVSICVKSNAKTITINGSNYAKGRDGLNIVVYNKYTDRVEDSCSLTRDGVTH